jgi:hypothetical protein
MSTRRRVSVAALVSVILVVVLGFFGRVAAQTAVRTAELIIGPLTLTPTPLVIGNSLTVSTSVRNEGRARATSTSVTFWLVPAGQASNATSYQPLAVASVGTVLSGSTVPVATSLRVPSTKPDGSYEIVATATSSLPEWDKTDNTALATLQIHRSAATSTASSTIPSSTRTTELSIGPLTLTPTPVILGNSLTARTSVRNEGRARATATYVAFWLALSGQASNTSSYSRLAVTSLGTVLSGATLAVVTSLTLPPTTPPGIHQIVATASSSVPEWDKTDNTATAALQVVSPSSTASSSTSPTSGGSSTVPTAPTATNSCDYYASPAGTGNGLSLDAPFQVRNFWQVARPGKTLCLLDGTYTGASSMIAPYSQGFSGLSGQSGFPITVRALNDGAVLIDGQSANSPIVLQNNSYYTIEGVNACCSAGSVVTAYTGADNNIFRRIVAWNAYDGGPGSGTNSHGILILGNNNVVEDSAVFGKARNVVGTYKNNNTTLRRVWARYEGYESNTGPKVAFQLAYYSDNVLCENCIGTWTSERVADCANLGYDPAIFKIGTNPNTLTRLLGSIAYQTKSAICNPVAGVYSEGEVGGAQHIRITDVVSRLPIPAVRPFTFNAVTDGVATRITGIKGSDSASQNWTVRDFNEATTVAAVPNIFTATDAANVCFQYINGVRTSAALWPWPMDARIKAALRAARSSALAGADGTVTSEVESMFGVIPPQCKG